MKTVTLPRDNQSAAIVKLYTSISELSSFRWKELQKWQLMDSGIGADQEAIERHEQRIEMFEQSGKTNYANLEKLYLHNCRFLMEKGVKPKNRAFACLVAYIDNQPFDDLSEDGIEEALKQLIALGMTEQQMHELRTEAVKTMEQERIHIDPDNPIESPEETYSNELYRRCRAICDFIITEDPEHLKTLEEVHEWFMKTLRPPSLNLNSPHNELSEMDRQFAQLCAWMRTEGIQEPDRLSVYDMQQHLLFFQKRYEKQNQKHL